MPELTREEKLKLLGKLSPRLQELMTSEDTGATLLYLGQKYHLSDHQVRLLSKILGNVILGILPATNLPMEISTKAAVDTQTASGLAQDLNDLILSLKPTAAAPTPAPIMPISVPTRPLSDQYRESISSAPEIVDLRKTPPPPPVPMPVAPLPIPSRSPMPIPGPAPLIEANPHRMPVLTPTLRPPLSEIGAPTSPKASVGVEAEPHKTEPLPQYIMRPPGLPPTDLPRDVLDLRKDKGEF